MFLIYFLIAGVILLTFWLVSSDICWKEALTQFGIQTLLIFIMCLAIKNAHLSDHEILNGRVVSKDNERVSCRHSYQCHCYTSCSGSGKNRSCRRVCRTCYEHSYDKVWFADDSIGKRTYIDTVNRQGTREPPRWTRIYIGEPVSHRHRYENYLKADPDSLFKYEAGKLDSKKFPSYPDKIYDYYYLDRVISDLTIDSKSWNRGLSEINADIGPAVQANVVLVITDKTTDHAKALQRVWEGAKKNDIVVVLGSDGSKIKWVEIIGLSYPDFKVVLRNAINDYKKLDLGLLEIIKTTTLKNFKRRPISEFQYLKESYKPTFGEWIAGAIISIILSLGLGVFFHKNEVYNTRRR